MKINVAPDGQLAFIYKDELRPFQELGKARTTRASHVEPTEDGQWTADLSPVGGPILGPFELRSQALEAEVRWLNQDGLQGSAKYFPPKNCESRT